MKSDARSGIIAGVGAYLLWGFLTVYWKAMTQFDAFELIGYRVVSSLLMLGIVLAALRRLHPLLGALRSRRLLLRIGVAAVLLTGNWTAYVWAVVHDNVMQTALGYFMAPLGTMLIGVLVLKERLRRNQAAAAVLALAAVGVLTVGYGRIPWVALTLAGTWSIYGLLKKQVPLGSLESLTAETMLMFVPALGIVAWGVGRPDGVPATADTWHWVLVVLSGVVTTVPLVLFAHAAQRVPFTLLGPVQYMVPTINFLLGWLVYGETLDTTRVVGFALVWCALAVITIDTVRHSRRAAAAATALAAGVLASCGAGTEDFARQTERFIESTDMADAQGHSWSDASCPVPADTRVGTRFTCQASDETGRPWIFEVVVTEDQGILVSDGRPTADAVTTTTTTTTSPGSTDAPGATDPVVTPGTATGAPTSTSPVADDPS